MKALLGIAFIFPTLAFRQTDDNPVTRVVGLLEQLKSRIESDGKTEQAAYDKYACWCEKSTQKTAATITDIKDLLKLTGSTILKLKGSVATLSSEIKGLVQDIKENEDKQAEQTSIREKENAAFMAEKAELESAIGALEKAIQVLKAATSASFVQTTAWKSTVSEAIAKMSEVSNVRLNEKQLSLISQLSDHQETYAPQSATIQGILSDMYTTFSKNLQTSTADEAKAHRNYEELMAVFQKQLKTLQETLVKKEQRKAEHEIQLADATQTYADSEEQLKAEIKLFDTTKSACEEKTSAWSERSALRATELEGITKALDILTSDDAKKLFAKSIKPGFSKGAKASFVQVSSHTVSGVKVQKAFKVLEARAQQVHSFRLAALAAEVRTQAATSGMFDAVMKTIDELMAQLDEEEQADIKKVDECKEQYQDITSNKNDLDWKIENNKAKIQTHEKEIEQKTETKEVTIKDIESADKQLKEMKSERKEENDAYVEAKSDDEKAIGLLKKAKAALEAYFSEKSLLQKDPEPDLKISDKDNAKNQTKGVLSLLDMIIEDLQGELLETKDAEEAAQLAYEEMKKAVEEQKAKLEKAKINLEGQIAQENTAKDAETDLQEENEKKLTTEKETEVDLKKTCDDAIKLQPERRKKRAIEMDGLRMAKEFLGGMTSDALLQSPQSRSEKSVFPAFQTLSFLQVKSAL